jgi:hypothetical protein
MKPFALVSVLMAVFLPICAAQDTDSPAGQKPAASISSVCQLHKVTMSKKVVPIEYGRARFAGYEAELRDVQRMQFPNARDEVLGGCVVGVETSEEVWECAECRRAKNQWITTHPKPKNEKPANQALLPTPMSVTDRAGARSAPATGAADL